MPGSSSPGACLLLLPLVLQVQPWPVGRKNLSSPSISCPPDDAWLPPKLACLFLLPQELKPWLCWPPLRAPWMVGPRTAAPRAPRPNPTMPPSNAWLPVREGVSPPKKNFSSTLVGLLVFLLAEGELLLEEDETPPLNLSWQKRGETRVARGRRERWPLSDLIAASSKALLILTDKTSRWLL